MTASFHAARNTFTEFVRVPVVPVTCLHQSEGAL